MEQDNTLDIRPLPPIQRHPLIFQRFEALAPGESFLLVNDHDPKPLYYQFQAEHRRVYLGVSGAGAGGLASAAGPGQWRMIRVKRAYEDAAPDDGRRFLVDRLWPRGLKKEALALDGWLKEVAPSDELRRWFGHEPERWAAFQRRYAAELDEKPESWQPLLDAARQGDVTLVYAARDTVHNNAVALRDYLQRKLGE